VHQRREFAAQPSPFDTHRPHLDDAIARGRAARGLQIQDRVSRFVQPPAAGCGHSAQADRPLVRQEKASIAPQRRLQQRARDRGWNLFQLQEEPAGLLSVDLFFPLQGIQQEGKENRNFFTGRLARRTKHAEILDRTSSLSRGTGDGR